MQLIWENILSTAAEECGKTVIVVMKYDNRENFKLSRPGLHNSKIAWATLTTENLPRAA